MRVVEELACAEEIREEGVVVETPDSMRSCRFEKVEGLYSSCEDQVSMSMAGTGGVYLLNTTRIILL
jgi:hypothetical protein